MLIFTFSVQKYNYETIIFDIICYKKRLNRHDYYLSQILFFYFYCLECFSIVFLINNQHLSVICRVIGKIENSHFLSCKQGWCDVLFSLVQYTCRSSDSIWFFYLLFRFKHKFPSVCHIYVCNLHFNIQNVNKNITRSLLT